jgi:hypothetical protein
MRGQWDVSVLIKRKKWQRIKRYPRALKHFFFWDWPLSLRNPPKPLAVINSWLTGLPLFQVLGFTFSPSSTSRRMASGRDRSGSPCLVIQASRVAKGASKSLTPMRVPLPVVTGRPRAFLAYYLLKFRLEGMNT